MNDANFRAITGVLGYNGLNVQRCRGGGGTPLGATQEVSAPMCAKRTPSIHIPSQPPVVRFWHNVPIAGIDECWAWQGSKNPDGYGKMEINCSSVRAHRFSWEIHNGPIPKGLHVLHRCDNPSCVNPHHLFLGTHSDNMKDMVAKGRHRGGPQGERARSAKLTPALVLEIREKAAHGMSYPELGREYGMSTSAIGNVVLRRTWKHV